MTPPQQVNFRVGGDGSEPDETGYPMHIWI